MHKIQPATFSPCPGPRSFPHAHKTMTGQAQPKDSTDLSVGHFLGLVCRSWSRPAFAYTPVRHYRCLHCRQLCFECQVFRPQGSGIVSYPKSLGPLMQDPMRLRTGLLMEHVPVRDKELHRQRGYLDHTLCGCEPVVLAGRPRAARGHGTLHALRDLILHYTIWFKMISFPLPYIEVGSPNF